MRRRARPPKDPETVGSTIPRVLAELGLRGAVEALRVAECWPEAVGAEAARHAEPAAVNGDVLEVEVDSSVWAQHLQLRHDEILAALRERLGAGAPASLRIHVG